MRTLKHCRHVQAFFHCSDIPVSVPRFCLARVRQPGRTGANFYGGQAGCFIPVGHVKLAFRE
jgi:hypothetical protein